MRILISLLLCFTFITTIEVSAQTIEIVGGDTYDFGIVSSGTKKVETTLQIKNIGNDNLKISKIKTSCGCTKGDISTENIAPGEIATLDIKVKLPNRSGLFSKTVTIHSNDSDNPKKVIRIVADLESAITMNPRTLIFRDMVVGLSSISVMKLKNTTQNRITLNLKNFKPTYLSLVFPDSTIIEPCEEIDMVATVEPRKPGYFKCTVNIDTDNNEMKNISIVGYGNVRD